MSETGTEYDFKKRLEFCIDLRADGVSLKPLDIDELLVPSVVGFFRSY